MLLKLNVIQTKRSTVFLVIFFKFSYSFNCSNKLKSPAQLHAKVVGTTFGISSVSKDSN